MSSIAQRHFENVPIAELRPTQVTVGMREVDFKRSRWREKHSHEAELAADLADGLTIVLAGSRLWS